MQKVYIAMSGGVDSSVSAALLRERGDDVTGVFIRTWHPDFLECDWREERRDAMRVCADIGIGFQTLDLQKEYKRDVVDYMLREYAAGRTPNPDVMCNKHIKFGAFFDWAIGEGAEAVATGHYARVGQHEGKHALLAGMDREKDQSYFLWTLSQRVLEKVVLPVGGMHKAEVRTEAVRLGLHVSKKKDSQGVCFLGKVDMREFIKRFVETSGGSVLNAGGETVGMHDGAILYTFGQRHGFTITKRTPNDKPHYVVAKDIEANTITVSDTYKEKDDFDTDVLSLEEVNWILEESPLDGRMYQGRIRYRQPLQSCRTKGDAVVFDVPQKGVAPGQSVVLYDGDMCLGGGVVA